MTFFAGKTAWGVAKMMRSSKLVGALNQMGTRWSRALLTQGRFNLEARRGSETLQSLQEESGPDWSSKFRWKWVAPAAGMAGLIGEIDFSKSFI